MRKDSGFILRIKMQSEALQKIVQRGTFMVSSLFELQTNLFLSNINQLSKLGV